MEGGRRSFSLPITLLKAPLPLGVTVGDLMECLELGTGNKGPNYHGCIQENGTDIIPSPTSPHPMPEMEEDGRKKRGKEHRTETFIFTTLKFPYPASETLKELRFRKSGELNSGSWVLNSCVTL